MKKYRFYKEDGVWFIDLKFFPFKKAWLAMVAGADTLLDTIAFGDDEITLEMSTKPFPGWQDNLKRTHKLGLFKGAVYESTDVEFYNSTILDNHLWLCPTTVWIFFRYPKNIYYKVWKKEEE